MTQDAPVQYPNKIPVKIESIQFPNNLLCMAGVTNPVFNGSGFGVVNCQADENDIDKNPYEIFDLIRHPFGAFSFESHAFPGNFLRMSGEKNPNFDPSGFGTVNCQAQIGPWEQFVVEFLGDSPQGNIVAIQSAADPNNYLRMAGVPNPQFTDNGFGTVNCQAGHGAYEAFHLGGILEKTIDLLVRWYDKEQPTEQQIEDLIQAMITQEQTDGPESLRTLFGENWHRHSPEELAAIESVDLDALSPCTLAIITFCVDVLLFVLQLIGIRIMRTNQMVQAAVLELGDAANGLTNIIAAIGANIPAAARATQIFNLVQQIFNIGALKGIVKALVNGFSWWGAVIAVLSFIAQVIAWIASGGALLIAQIVGAVIALAGIVSDAVGVASKCRQVAAAGAGVGAGSS